MDGAKYRETLRQHILSEIERVREHFELKITLMLCHCFGLVWSWYKLSPSPRIMKPGRHGVESSRVEKKWL